MVLYFSLATGRWWIATKSPCVVDHRASLANNGTPYPSITSIMPEQLLYPNTRSQAKHVYTETEVRVISSELGGCGLRVAAGLVWIGGCVSVWREGTALEQASHSPCNPCC